MSLLMKPEPFSQEFDRLFTRLFDAQNAPPQRWVPAMDLTEAEDHFVLTADLPGLGEDDVSIEVGDTTLTVSGERKAEHVRREQGWHRIERSFGRFSRALTLPDGVTADHGNADEMLLPDGSPQTAHSLNPVPIIVTADVGPLPGGVLADIAPTVLALLEIGRPQTMTGRALVPERLDR